MNKSIKLLILFLISLSIQGNMRGADIIFNWQAGKGFFPFQTRKTKNKDVAIKQLKNVDGHNCCSIYDNTKDGSAVLSYQYSLDKLPAAIWANDYTVSLLCRIGTEINPPTGADLIVIQGNKKNLLMLRLESRRTLWLGMNTHLSGDKQQRRIFDNATNKAYRMPIGKWVLIQLKRLSTNKIRIFINQRNMGEYDSLIPLSTPMTKLTLRSLIRGKAQIQWAAVAIAASKYDKNIAQGNWPAMKNVIKNPKKRTLSFNLDNVAKDLRDSIQGVDAESHATCANYKILLSDLKQDFSKLLQAAGRPVLRMMDLSRYSWRSAKVNDILRGYPSGKSKKFWYSPAQFHKFCRENRVKIIGMFDTRFAYNPKTGKRVQIYDTPENFKIGVAENMRKLKWVIDNGYLDLYTCWEIGSENYSPWEKPEQYAKYALMLATAAKQLDPKIRLAVDVFVCAPDDPNLMGYKGNGEKLRDKWYRWSTKMLTALGDGAKNLYYINIHLYGASSRYNANYKGIHTHLALLKKFPATKHMRFIVTEWRHTGVGDRKHRQFKTAALWKAKFTLVLIAYPLIDYTAVHDFLTWSGVGYYSDGKVWFRQGDVPRSPKTNELFKCKSGKPSLDIGMFAPVLKMANHIVRNYPLLLVHQADLENESSNLFAALKSATPASSSPTGAGRDLEWIICSNRDNTKIGCMLVNTQTFPIKIQLKDQYGKVWEIERAEALTCEPNKRFDFEIPGEKKYWHLASFKVNYDGSATLPPMSVTTLEAH